MDKQLTEFQTKWVDKPNRHLAKAHAEAYCQSNRTELEAKFGSLTLEQMVAEVDHYRAQGREEDLIKADMWLLANFAPQRIIGSYGPTPVRSIK